MQSGQSLPSDNFDAYFDELRSREFDRLDRSKDVYLDYTGGGLYPKSLILKHQELLLNSTFGNPHSENPTSLEATAVERQARKDVLTFFNVRGAENIDIKGGTVEFEKAEYYCIFTQNASGALKIVGESYHFDKTSSFLILVDNHNSVHGIRMFCEAKGGQFKYMPLRENDLMIDESVLNQALNQAQKGNANLLAFPAQSNATGVKHDLKWIEQAHNAGFDVLLDAAAFVPTSRLDLSVVKPDYVSISFYKIFGYPTGIGCLLVRKDKIDKLQKPWFAGGTVRMVSVVNPDKPTLHHGHERFEDGTINYLGLSAVSIGLNFISDLDAGADKGVDLINKRIAILVKKLIADLKALKHANGKPVVKIYGPEGMDSRGGNIAINFLDEMGSVVDYSGFDSELNPKGISIRTNCFCNPGTDELNHNITFEDVESVLQNCSVSQSACSRDQQIVSLGKMRGAIRVSVGIATNWQDIAAFLDFAKTKCK